ncbi:c-type cytochrome biogenesis protein CcmI [Thiorhodospira sibirica]|uniref:c-type cytochrome biogenesis protein CcmI n=1 Tax=Thiorhodospira sibirica TaxID=154347 RepID=UPI00022C22E5|nr:c-type cytochrome biogenesis protein CcmI [Thiorhodospira sibirica]
MIFFWFIGVMLVLAALAFILLPLLRPARHTATRPALPQTGLAIYQTQLAELERDRKADLISEAHYQSAKVDLQRNLLEISAHESQAAAVMAQPVTSWRLPASVISGLLVPILALWLYASLGTAAIISGGTGQSSMHELEAVIANLYARLEAAPENPAGWAMLARSYQVIGRDGQAIAAYERALQHGGEASADLLLEYADLMGATRPEGLSGQSMRLIEQALALEPRHPKGLWLAGSGYFYEGDYATALTYWEPLLELLPPTSEEARMMRANLDDLRTRIQSASEATPAE